MKTLVTDDFAEREPYQRIADAMSAVVSSGSNTTTHNASWIGVVRLEDVPEGPIRDDGPIRTQAWVGRPIPELAPGDLEGRLE